LTVDQKNNTFVLKKDGFSSHNSPYMLNMDSDEFDDWVLSAKTSIDQQIEKKDLEIERLQNKESVFLTFVNTFCVPSGEGDGMYILSLAKIKASEYSIYYDFSNFYDFTGRYAIKK
jgi:uncharacterized protein YcsI (UPF0317 family)